MPESTIEIRGARKREYLRRLFRVEAGLAPELADRLVTLTTARIRSLRVLRADLAGPPRRGTTAATGKGADAIDRTVLADREEPVSPAGPPPPDAKPVSDRIADPKGPGAASKDAPPVRAAAAPASSPAAEAAPGNASPPEADASSPGGAPFDPYAFAVVPLLRRQGRDTLLARLAEIASPADLRRLAEAQNIGLPPSFAAETSAGAVRRAIVEGAEKRVADRHAAAG